MQYNILLRFAAVDGISILFTAILYIILGIIVNSKKVGKRLTDALFLTITVEVVILVVIAGVSVWKYFYQLIGLM